MKIKTTGLINKSILIGGTLLLPGIIKSESSNKEHRKNVLMILVDDLKPNLGCYGDSFAISPNIDKLASDGVVFNNAYCNQSVSVASRYNLLTGVRSTTSGLYDFGTDFREVYPDAVTLPQYFMQHGYHAEAIGKVFHEGHGTVNDVASWSIPHHKDKLIEYIVPESTNRKLTREEALFENSRMHLPDLPPIGQLPRGAAWESPDVLDEAYADGRIATHAINRLRELNKNPDQPFFMALGFVRPHLPFSAPKKYWDLYDMKDVPMPEYVADPVDAPRVATKRGGEIDQYREIPAGKYVFEDPLTQKLIHGYYASMSYMDAQLGKVIDELKRLGMYENTIIILWGDHGWHLGDHGYWTKHTNYEEANKIPLIMIAPGVAQVEGSSNQLIETVDIYPTLTSLAGLGSPDTPQPIDGIDMTPVLKNTDLIIRDHVYHAYPHGGYIGRAIRTDRYRLIEWKKWDDNKDVMYELYDYLEDPLETRNIAGQNRETLKQMKSILARHPEAKRN